MRHPQEHSQYFDSPAINREYLRWRKKIGADSNADSGVLALSAREVLRAHFLIAEFFADEENGLGGLGPRDENGNLLHSALSRQTTGFGSEKKWTDNFHIAATAFFGLVKNHPFHDGNKRTALLSVLHLLGKQGYTASVEKRYFDNLTLSISRYQKKNVTDDDSEVERIADKLRKYMRRFDRSHRTLTYRQLNGLIKQRGYEMRDPNHNLIAIVRMEDGQAIKHVRFPGMSKEVSKSILRRVRAACKLSEADGCDSKRFFNGAEEMDFLLSEYAAPLRRLADK